MTWKTHQSSAWKNLVMPDEEKFRYARAGCSQRVELPSGDILLPSLRASGFSVD